jgi:hypothetical protein
MMTDMKAVSRKRIWAGKAPDQEAGSARAFSDCAGAKYHKIREVCNPIVIRHSQASRAKRKQAG